ncbi:hypothetical protein MA9V2_081 [Chryseobacterium phage MA9V-2]|nr:hypothetical protein MA9V2_081 [Chryseobacterium phage MA9V-2]
MSLFKVPVFTKLNAKNGTLYNLQNFNNDLTQSLANSTTFKRAPSKFVCVKIPKWNNANGRHVYLAPDKISTTPLVSDPNVLIPKLLQNYAENMSAYASKEEITDSNIPEWAFWKLMQTLGAVDLDVNADGSIFDKLTDDGNFVKYVGDMNLVNYVEYGNRTYTELYLHIPSDAKPLDKLNWTKRATTTKSSSLSRLPILENGQNTALGLTPSPTELTDAVYDFDDAGNTKQYYDLSRQTDKSVLDFGSGVSVEGAEDFDFNAILMYYDTWEVDATGRTFNFKTKLGSVFFLDHFVQNAAQGYWEIPSITKYNSAENNTVAGNALAFRLCTTFFSTNAQATIDTIINQYNNLSMDLYVKALSEMMKTAEYFQNDQGLIQQIAERLSRLNYGEDLFMKLAENEAKLQQLTNTVNALTGASGYQVTNFELLDAFKKLSDDFKGINGQNIENTFVFGQTAAGETIQFNRLYAYIQNGKYSIGYADETMLQIGLIRNRLLSKYGVNATKANGKLTLTLKGATPQLTYAIDGKVYTNATNNQVVQISFASDLSKAYAYVLVINKNNGKLELYDYDYMKKTALEDFAYVGSFILPTEALFDTNGLVIDDNDDTKGTKLTNDLHVSLRPGENQGTYDTGDVIPAGTTLMEIVQKMLVDSKNQGYITPELEVTANTVGMLGQLNVIPVDWKVMQNDGGDIDGQHFTSNAITIKFNVDFTAGIIKIGQYEYSVTDNTALGKQQNQMFTVTTNQSGDLILYSESLKINTTDFGTIDSNAEDPTDPGTDNEFYQHSIIVTAGTAAKDLTLNIQLDYDASLNFKSGRFLFPVEFSASFTNLLIEGRVAFQDGPVKYDFAGNPISGNVQASTKLFQFTFGKRLPVILYQAADANNVPDITTLNKIFLFDEKAWYKFMAQPGLPKLIFATPKNIGYEIQLGALYVDDVLRSNLLAATRFSDEITINSEPYFIDAYDIPAGFLDVTKVKAIFGKVGQFVSFDSSYDMDFI